MTIEIINNNQSENNLYENSQILLYWKNKIWRNSSFEVKLVFDFFLHFLQLNTHCKGGSEET